MTESPQGKKLLGLNGLVSSASGFNHLFGSKNNELFVINDPLRRSSANEFSITAN